METMDQSKTRVETCDAVTSDPSIISSETDLIVPAPFPPQDSASTADPASCQESKVLSNKIQPGTPNIIVLEAAASDTRRNRLPKPNLSRVSRSMQYEPAEAASSSGETFSAPVRPDLEAKPVESQISAVKDLIPEAPSQPEAAEQSSEICEEREHDKTEGCSPVTLLEKKMEDAVCVEEESKEETQQIHRYSRKHLHFILALPYGLDYGIDQ